MMTSTAVTLVVTRYDDNGLLYTAPIKEKKQGGGTVSSVRPAIPDTGWKRPTDFPNLKDCKLVAFDLETRDPNLKELGPGPRRKDREGGFIAGFAVSTGPREGEQWYFPVRHEDCPDNFDPDQVYAWAKDNLCVEGQAKLGANLLYDLDWSWSEGIPVTGPYFDVQNAEPLIDENAGRYSLDLLGNKYAGEGKDEDAMNRWLSLVFGGAPNRQDQAKNIWRAPSKLAGPYAESDVRLPFIIWEEQQKIIEREELSTVLDVETRLVPLLLAMRLRGVAVDSYQASEVDDRLMSRAKELRSELSTEHHIDPWSGDTIARWCKLNDVPFQKTAAGNPSFPGKWLENHGNEVLQIINECRKLEKHAGTFVQGTIMGHSVAGRLHCQFNQLRGDEFGTVSGRFSSSNPNLQNIPARDGELGPLIRGLFIPDEGEEWFSDDWSQIEYRLLVHYAMGAGAADTVRRYNEDPTTDFHSYVAEIAGIDRKPAKTSISASFTGWEKPHWLRTSVVHWPMSSLSSIDIMASYPSSVRPSKKSRRWPHVAVGSARSYEDVAGGTDGNHATGKSLETPKTRLYPKI